MKKILITTLSIALFLTGCATTPKAEFNDSAPITTNEITLTVHGLSCPLCSNNLDGQLKKIDGVEGATIDLKTGAVTITLSDKHTVTKGQLAKAVDAAGFTLANINTDGE